jgi:DNA (cytosine-5)-methyltransferase 1
VTLSVGSVFSGIGGIEFGFEKEGFETKWFIEYNPYCQEVLKKHWPDVPIYGDITKVDFTKLEKVDCLTGGFPCQDISVAGRHAGILEGKRSSLWKYYAEAIGILRPKVAVIENVPNLANLGLNVVLADLAEKGYGADFFTICARDVGAPHKRERLFIIARRCIL